MRLCWLIPDDRGGGVASVAVSCCRQAAAAGHDVTLLMALSPTGHLDEHVDNFVLESLEIEGQSPEAPRRLLEWLGEHPQDVLLFNGCSEVEPAIPHVPQDTHAVSVIHDTAPKYWRKTIEHESALDTIVAVSETVARQFRGELQDPEHLHVCHNGTVFPPEPDPAQTRPDDLLFLGGGTLQKGAEDVLELWSRLVDDGYEGNLHWLGDLEPSLKERIRSLPSSGKIQCPGRVSRSEVFERAAKTKILLMLSRVESFGMATVEAMGMGCVPVAWGIETGTEEIVVPGKTGFLVPLGDYETLSERIREVLNQHSTMVEKAQVQARNRFSEAAMWSRYEAVIGQITARSPVARPQAGTAPPHYEPPTRYFQLLPGWARDAVRSFVARSPRLNYWLRDWRGF